MCFAKKQVSSVEYFLNGNLALAGIAVKAHRKAVWPSYLRPVERRDEMERSTTRNNSCKLVDSRINFHCYRTTIVNYEVAGVYGLGDNRVELSLCKIGIELPTINLESGKSGLL